MNSVEFDVPQFCNAVYLHYLDRELNIAAGRPVPGHDAVRATRLLALLTDAELYCGLSALWENDNLDDRSLDDFAALLYTKQLQTVSSDITTGEFLESRRLAYQHDQQRYPAYFSNNGARLLWSYPTWQKRSGSTRPLARYLVDWAEGETFHGKFRPAAIAVRKPVREALVRREDQAITYSLFQPLLGDLEHAPLAAYTIRRQISKGFTEDYLRHGAGTIATGIPELEVFDELAVDFPGYDVRLLAELGNVVGLSAVVDPIATEVAGWQRYLHVRDSGTAQLLAGTVRWILTALYARETIRTPRRADDAERFYGQHQVRTRMIAAIRTAARAAARLRPPAAGSSPDKALERSQRRLLWLAERIAGLDPLAKTFLDSGRASIMMPTVDVVLVTVTDTETDALTRALESAGYRGRFELGPVNTYWVYGPIGGAVVAHVRSGMGSAGQGGSGLTTVDAIRDLRPGAILGVGVAFGVDDEAQPIGQLLLSERITEYERAKITTDPSGGTLVLSRGPSSEASPRLLGRFRDARLAGIGVPVRAGELVCGEKLIDNASFKAALIARFPEAIGGEMEGAGVQAASGREGVEWLVVKAVCDYAREKGTDKRARQELAASHAAKAVLHVLEKGGLGRRHG